MKKKIKNNSHLKWYSSFYQNKKLNNLFSYSFFIPKPTNLYKNEIFLLLPDFEGLGVSMKDEENIIKKIQTENSKINITVFPHRRGRFNLYKQMKLNIKKNIACFEHWYINSEFINCKIYSTPSSATWILLDKRLTVNIFCKEFIHVSKNETNHYSKFC